MIGRLRSGASPALVVLASISFVSSLGISIMLPLLPLYGLFLGASPLQLGLMTSVFAVTNALSQLGTGFLADRFGSRRFILAGTATYATANALIATAGSALALIAFRGLAGIGGGANILGTRLYVSHAAPRADLAFFNSVLSAAASAGNVFGPAFGGLVAVASDLRVPFVIVAGTSFVAFLAATRLPRLADARSAPAVAGEPTSALNRSVLVLLAGNFLLLIGFGGWITSYAPFATTRLGWTTLDVGIIFTVFGLGDITLGPWLGRLADRTGRRRMAIVASLPIFLFGFALVLAWPRPVLYAVSLVTGAALTAYNASWFALLTTAVPAARRGRVFGTVNAVGSIGTVVGALAASALWENADLAYALVMASVAAGLSGLVLLALPREIRPQPERAAASAPGE